MSGENSHDFAISKSTLHSKIAKTEKIQGYDILNEIAEENSQVAIHFDGKKFYKLIGQYLTREQRIIVICHTEEM